MKDDDEQELSRRLRKGDSAAFDVVFARYSRPLLRIAWLKTGDYEEAGDAVQDALLVLWRRRADIPERSMFPWLVGVLTLVIRNRDRAHRRRPTESLDEFGEIVSVDGMSEERRDALLDVIRSLDHLTELERRIVLYCAVEDLTYEEAGERVGLSSQAVRKRFQRLRLRLRQTAIEER